jgi:hypothetical protein
MRLPIKHAGTILAGPRKDSIIDPDFGVVEDYGPADVLATRQLASRGGARKSESDHRWNGEDCPERLASYLGGQYPVPPSLLALAEEVIE